MNGKRMLAGLCAGAMALSLSAFAAPIDNPNKTTFEGAVATGTISVKVRAGKTNLYVNPYGVSYNLGNGEIKNDPDAAFAKETDLVVVEGATAAGFFSDTALIENNSDAALKVGVTLTTTVKTGSTVKVVGTTPASAPVDNTMYGNYEITSAALSTGTAEVSKADNTKVEMAGVSIVTPNWNDTNKKTFAIPAGGATAGTAGSPSTSPDAQNYVLPKATSTTDPDSGVTTVTPSYAAFRLTGSAVKGSGATDWEDSDLVDVAVAFTFTPAP